MISVNIRPQFGAPEWTEMFAEEEHTSLPVPTGRNVTGSAPPRATASRRDDFASERGRSLDVLPSHHPP
eukprot:6207472-Pleurochrysis_carterae.AAC.8